MLAGVAVCALAIPSATALASRDDVRTHATLKLTRKVEGDVFKGRVTSAERACVPKRRLKLLFLGRDGSKETVAKLKSDRKGHWKHVLDDEDDQANPGMWQIVAKRARVGTDEGNLTCMRGESDRIPIN